MDPESLFQQGGLLRIDRVFASMIHRIDGKGDPWVALAAGLVSRAAADGDVCLDLESTIKNGIQTIDDNHRISVDITLERWRQALDGSFAVGKHGDKKPMILDGNLLYLQRYWNYENLVSQSILERCGFNVPEAAMADVEVLVRGGKSDRQHLDPDQDAAVLAALSKRFIVISGGPGTGKTTTIARIITALNQLNSDASLRIMLAAPTGKAAARMQEALVQGIDHLMHDEACEIPSRSIEAKTLHRLLGIVPGKHQSRYSPQNPLPADVVIVDEASMIDLSLMAKLIQAVAPNARLILVGDKDQLSSVEAGSVMGDICAGAIIGKHTDSHGKTNAERRTDLSNHLVVLRRSYRFSSGSGIDALGRAINDGDSRQAVALLNDPLNAHIGFIPIATFNDVERHLSRLVMEAIAPIFGTSEPLEALAQLEQIKILTPMRRGPFGVAAINEMVEATLRRHDCIKPAPGLGGQWYPGRPVIMNRNDYYHHLFNGDVGVTMLVHTDGMQQVRVGFQDGQGQIRHLAPEQLPDHETVYAMSVHKSQGTEFQKVVLILPDRDSPLLTRELIYTAVTRARHRVEIWGRPDILAAAVGRRIHRASGLRNKLWQVQ